MAGGTIEVATDQVAAVGYWGALGVAGIFFLMGFGNNNFPYWGAACFLGIVARVLQAELHHRQARGR